MSLQSEMGRPFFNYDSASHGRGANKLPRQLYNVTFRARNETPWWLRDARRRSGTQEYSWSDIFSRDGFQCVYCDAELSASTWPKNRANLKITKVAGATYISFAHATTPKEDEAGGMFKNRNV